MVTWVYMYLFYLTFCISVGWVRRCSSKNKISFWYALSVYKPCIQQCTSQSVHSILCIAWYQFEWLFSYVSYYIVENWFRTNSAQLCYQCCYYFVCQMLRWNRMKLRINWKIIQLQIQQLKQIEVRSLGVPWKGQSSMRWVDRQQNAIIIITF